jgi:hypothetical protein
MTFASAELAALHRRDGIPTFAEATAFLQERGFEI